MMSELCAIAWRTYCQEAGRSSVVLSRQKETRGRARVPQLSLVVAPNPLVAERLYDREREQPRSGRDALRTSWVRPTTHHRPAVVVTGRVSGPGQQLIGPVPGCAIRFLLRYSTGPVWRAQRSRDGKEAVWAVGLLASGVWRAHSLLSS
ncbi:hypothetical protein GGTG_11476 [Gaeumannomyces tritici R3-111a-1]|uniref:Uncharacterized protein n=1 Tax=Gaeumannomyces tritici (strain R3-111a-1) TaxID=644352 RepID=J3PDA8_GAET3|nr:hypothetical protein GGTG_11476 [Gaeumannomyces tritici R3-111a-1]EJT70453.1 hypothetical protein GGTG_11476 [Gaeumannomyces tritici R3-111a-1]